MNVIILCGGLSTRLGDITKDTPKILLEIGDRTVLDWQLEKVRELGVKEIVLAAGHLSDVLLREVGEERGGIRLIHAVEPERLGTGGAIKFAWQHVPCPEESVLVLNGDILATAPVQEMMRMLRPESDGVILGSKVPDASTYGTLMFDDEGKLLSFREKEGKIIPGHINGGFYLFNPSVRKYFPDAKAFSIEYDVFPHIQNLFVYASDHHWVDVGVPHRLAWAKEHWHIFLERHHVTSPTAS